jgi:hypothetical protein
MKSHPEKVAALYLHSSFIIHCLLRMKEKRLTGDESCQPYSVILVVDLQVDVDAHAQHLVGTGEAIGTIHVHTTDG